LTRKLSKHGGEWGRYRTEEDMIIIKEDKGKPIFRTFLIVMRSSRELKI